MNTSPSKPQIPGPLPEQKPSHWFESFFARVALYIAISAICEGLLALTATASQKQSPWLVILFSSLVPAVVLGIAFAIIQNFDDRTRSLEKYVKETQHTQETLMKRYTEEIEKLSREDHANAHNIELLTQDCRSFPLPRIRQKLNERL